MGVIGWIYYHSDKSNTVNTVALGIVLAGAGGNLWDRIFHHSVRDFIDVHIKNYHWPTFNVADILICVGVGLLILKTVKTAKVEEQDSKAEKQ